MSDPFDKKEIEKVDNKIIRELYEENDKKDRIIQNAIDLIFGLIDHSEDCPLRKFFDFDKEKYFKYCLSNKKCLDCIREHVEEVKENE